MLRTLGFMVPALVVLSGAAVGQQRDAFAYNRQLGRGINLGNALEAPAEGEWGLTIRRQYFKAIADAGFDSVRIPIRWSAHAEKQPPYRIDPPFAKRVDEVVEQALGQDLAVVINFHHYEELYANPDTEQPRFLALWKQVAQRYKDQPDRLCFELLNEPHGDLSAGKWNELLVKALQVVRESNPERIVIVGPAQWNNISHLDRLRLPENDRRLIATFHYYSPFQFTHQGASWVENSEPWLGTKWEGTAQEKKAVADDLDRAVRWAQRERRPLYMGEFGAYSRADMESRARWTRFLAGEAAKRDISWAYWEFASGFGAYDPQEEQWREPLRKALLGDQ